jgi:hypothetical protein
MAASWAPGIFATMPRGAEQAPIRPLPKQICEGGLCVLLSIEATNTALVLMDVSFSTATGRLTAAFPSAFGVSPLPDILATEAAFPASAFSIFIGRFPLLVPALFSLMAPGLAGPVPSVLILVSGLFAQDGFPVPNPMLPFLSFFSVSLSLAIGLNASDWFLWKIRLLLPLVMYQFQPLPHIARSAIPPFILPLFA